ncbi:MAG: WD40 repeat domain-containing protein, partial [Planctomycetes bacterium]|nr:WD40 repeat domain-containing protein [Planctomycetota bacterium]
VLIGHNCPVVGAAFSPLSNHLVSVDHVGKLFVWDCESGAVLNQIDCHQGRTQCLEFSKDGTRLVTCGDDDLVKIWDVRKLPDAPLVREIDGHKSNVHCVSWSSDGRRLVSGGWDCTVRVWTEGEDAVLRELARCPHQIQSVSFSDDDQYVTCSTNASSIHQYESTSGKIVDTLLHQGGRCWGIKYSPDNRWLASAGGNSMISIWKRDHRDGRGLQLVETESPILKMAPTYDGRFLVTLDRLSKLVVRSANTGACTFQIPGEFQKMSIGITTDHRLIVASKTSDIEFWDLSGDTPRKLVAALNERAEFISVNPKGTLLSHLDHVPWNLHTGLPDSSWKFMNLAESRLVFGVNEHWHAVLPNGPGSGFWWNPTTGDQRQISCFNYHSKLAFHPDGLRVYSGNPDGLIYETEVGNPDPIRLPFRCEACVNDMTVSQDGKTLLSGSRDGRLTFWNLESGGKMFSIDHHDEEVLSMTWVPNEMTLIYSTPRLNDQTSGGNLRFIRLTRSSPN